MVEEQLHRRGIHDPRVLRIMAARWIGEPVAFDVTTLDPPGVNQGLARFGISDF